MPKPKFTASPDGPLSLDDSLARLTARREELVSRKAELDAAAESAVSARREVLIEGADAAASAEAERACREAESAALALTDALAEVDRRITATQERIAAEREATQIAAVADGLDLSAGGIEKAAAILAKAIAGTARAYASLAAAIDGTAAGQYSEAPRDGLATPNGIARQMLLQGLVSTMPDLDLQAELLPWSLYNRRETVAGADPVVSAAAFRERLRAVAARVRDREIGSDLPVSLDIAPLRLITVELQEIHVINPFFYRSGSNRQTIVSSPITHVPYPVAERAIELGVAADGETPEWRSANRRFVDSRKAAAGEPVTVNSLHVTGAVPIGLGDCIDLGFDLDAWKAEARQAA